MNNFQRIGNWIAALLLGNTREIVSRIDERTLMMEKELRDVKMKVDDMFPKVNILWESQIKRDRSLT